MLREFDKDIFEYIGIRNPLIDSGKEIFKVCFISQDSKDNFKTELYSFKTSTKKACYVDISIAFDLDSSLHMKNMSKSILNAKMQRLRDEIELLYINSKTISNLSEIENTNEKRIDILMDKSILSEFKIQTGERYKFLGITEETINDLIRIPGIRHHITYWFLDNLYIPTSIALILLSDNIIFDKNTHFLMSNEFSINSNGNFIDAFWKYMTTTMYVLLFKEKPYMINMNDPGFNFNKNLT